MALFNCNFYSEALGMGVSMNVTLPQATHTQIAASADSVERESYPTLYLLHGLTGDYPDYCRFVDMETLSTEHGIAIVMPVAHRSFYLNMYQGLDYATYIRDEIPALTRKFFPLSHKREDTFIGGLSMGGYGAFITALNSPDTFSACFGLSSVFDVLNFPDDDVMISPAEYIRIFGPKENVTGSDSDLYKLAEESATKPNTPKLYACCGTEDFLYEDNTKMRDLAKETGLNLHYEESPGEHNWDYWCEWLPKAIEWLPIRT